MTSWFSSLPLCCTPLASCVAIDRKQRCSKSLSTAATAAANTRSLGRSSDEELLMGQDDEKTSLPVVCKQPLHQPRLVAAPATMDQGFRERGRSRSLAAGRSGRKRLWSVSSTHSRRPQISAPSDFRHVSSASPQFLDQGLLPPPPATRQTPTPRLRRRSFRPLELSIYMPDNHVSPILPHFEFPTVTTPPPVYTRERPREERTLKHQRSYSSMSFHLPRKQTYQGSPSTIQEEVPPLIPPKAQARRRANTSPDVNVIKERVASAMIEVEKLQKQIDDVIERQSVYASSRPSTSHSMARTMPELEPMPSVPALPPAAPSFAERLNADIERPSTAPVGVPFCIADGVTASGNASTALKTPPEARVQGRLPPPPLPLVLRPPLRKKKSFSRVSTWLFSEVQHSRDLSLDSVTNFPRPVKDTEGFYQCVSPGETFERRPSVDSVNTVSTWNTDEEEHSVPACWSPGSTSGMWHCEQPIVSRNATFGSNDNRPRRTSVGVAF